MDDQDRQDAPPPKGEPAQEWGERHEAGKEIARGGRADGAVPGAGDAGRPEPEQEGR